MACSGVYFGRCGDGRGNSKPSSLTPELSAPQRDRMPTRVQVSLSFRQFLALFAFDYRRAGESVPNFGDIILFSINVSRRQFNLIWVFEHRERQLDDRISVSVAI